MHHRVSQTCLLSFSEGYLLGLCIDYLALSGLPGGHRGHDFGQRAAEPTHHPAYFRLLKGIWLSLVYLMLNL